MAMNYLDYPVDWKAIRDKILERAKNVSGISQCECIGECEREHKDNRCAHLQYQPLTTKSKHRVILTTAHLCHKPRCSSLNHLKSMCQPCHQIFDLRARQKRKAGLRDIFLERIGPCNVPTNEVSPPDCVARNAGGERSRREEIVSDIGAMGGRPGKKRHISAALSHRRSLAAHKAWETRRARGE